MKDPIHEPSAVEKASRDVLLDLTHAVTEAHRRYGVQMSEREFRVMLAGYFETKTIKDWCLDLGVPVPAADRRE